MMLFHRIYASISSVFRRLKVWTVSFVLLFTFSVGSSAELSSSVDSLMRFAGNIHQFNSIFPQEKVYLQFDNTSYYTGETVWFKAFVVNASTLNRPQSRVLYVDLISPNGILLKREKLKIKGEINEFETFFFFLIINNKNNFHLYKKI